MKIQRPRGTHDTRILRFADGDTVVCLIRLEMGVWVEKYVRLEGLESWELGGPDDAKAVAAREALDREYKGRDVLLHRTRRGHDRYGRVRGRITVGEKDLALEIIRLNFGWACSASDSAAAHRARSVAGVLALAVTGGCTMAREGSTLIYMPDAPHNKVAPVIRQAATIPTHTFGWVLLFLGVGGVVAGVLWLVHNRAKLVGMLATMAAKV